MGRHKRTSQLGRRVEGLTRQAREAIAPEPRPSPWSRMATGAGVAAAATGAVVAVRNLAPLRKVVGAVARPLGQVGGATRQTSKTVGTVRKRATSPTR